MVDPVLRQLVDELNQAEMQHFDEEGPLLMRLHRAIEAVCQYAGVQNLWDQPDEVKRDSAESLGLTQTE
jgi:hypothetical protein